jgi:hypothetical protein
LQSAKLIMVGNCNVMSKLKIPAALLVMGAMSLGVPPIAAPATPLSAAAKLMAQESELGPWQIGC